jgi:DNA-binding CsgD family transcriptional regulator/tetratricopeptide (TPR) repeat protein
VVVGRETERQTLALFLESLSDGPSVLMLEGEPGIGKTTLWLDAVDLARSLDVRVLATRPAQPDAELSFSALTDLLESVLSQGETDLPEPQGRAVRVALLRQSNSRPADRRALCAGVLTMLRQVASAGPILIAIDDAQWLDPDSAGVIEFSLRRLVAEPLGVLIARRAAPDDRLPADLRDAIVRLPSRSLLIGPLSFEAISLIIGGHVGVEPRREALQEIHRLSGGNPFFALELGRALSRDDERPTGLSIPIPRTLRQDLVRQRLGTLPKEAGDVLVAAAAIARPTPELLSKVLALDVEDALESATRAGLLQVSSEGVTFSHPLYQSAVYADASRSTRHRIHAQIAVAVDDPEERARHLSLSADAADRTMAAAIELGADAAAGRGALGSAADLMGHAARLTPDDDRDALVRRLRIAGECRFQAGSAIVGMSDVRRAVDAAGHGPARAVALASLASMEWESLQLLEARQHFEAALDETGTDRSLACTIHSGLFWTLYDLGALTDAAAHADRALYFASGDEAVDARGFDAAMTAAVLQGDRRAEGLKQEPSRRATPDEGLTPWERRRIGHGRQLVWIGQLDEARAHLNGMLASAIEFGDEASRRWLLADLADVDRRQGRWKDGLARALEAQRLAEEMDEPARDLGLLAWLEGGLGHEEDAEQHAHSAVKLGDAFMPGRVQGLAALGMLSLARGDAESAHKYLSPATARFFEMGIREPGWEPFLPDAVEAALGAGDWDIAERVTAWLEERASNLDRPSLHGDALRSRGLLLSAERAHDAAELAVASAVTHHRAGPSTYDLARTHLAHGAIHRRAGRKREGRASLDQARALFSALGAVRWVARTAAESDRIGGRRPSGSTLTDAELRVARLAAAGRSNREIADSLFASVRTVEGHLSHVYAKLEIRSRTELAIFFDEGSDDGPTS